LFFSSGLTSLSIYFHNNLMSLVKLLTASAGLALLCTLKAQAASPSVLTPQFEHQVRALVHKTQPRATFATAPDILIGQYRTENQEFQTRGPDGSRLPPVIELGPLAGGFYLQLDAEKSAGQGTVQYTAPSKNQPWTTVVSTYPVAHTGQTIIMTWEAASGAPPHLFSQLRGALLHYSERHM
jgi:hypothetical protein